MDTTTSRPAIRGGALSCSSMSCTVTASQSTQKQPQNSL
jgi:hypothetical protein